MFIKKYAKYLIISLCLLLVLVAGTVSYFLFLDDKEVKANSNDDIISYVETTTSSTSELNNFYVDIKGCVVNPGVYLVNENNIVKDVIDMAGGLTKNAYTNNINLSLHVSPEMVIIVNSKKDMTTSTVNVSVPNDAQIKEEKKSNKTTSNGLVNINTASLEELLTISGIGEGKAKSIIEYRSKEKFTTIEDIKKVSGIGDNLFEQIKNYITV